MSRPNPPAPSPWWGRLLDLPAPLRQPAADGLALLLRILFGWQFLLAGWGKLQNLERTTAFFSSLGIPGAGAHAIGVGVLEAVGGLLLLAGFGTRGVSVLLGATMLVALFTAHRDELREEGLDGLMSAAPFPYLLAVAGLVVWGPGRLALETIVRTACRHGGDPAK